MSVSEALSTHDIYERWAATYPPVAHNPLMRVEEQAMLDALPDLAGRRVLDLACGSGRYARIAAERAPASVVALDFCLAMLQQVEPGARVQASMTRLPFRDHSFDVVLSGLALGHTADLGQWMTEAARVLAPGGTLLYSDFHPDAARAGITRSFKGDDDRSYTLSHHEHEVGQQRTATAEAGLTVDLVRELRIGRELTEPFRRSESFYDRWDGVAIVLIVRARKG